MVPWQNTTTPHRVRRCLRALQLCLLWLSTTARGARPRTDAPVMAGYDLVAYHSLSIFDKGVPGKPEISHQYDSYVYYFSTEANRRLFIQNPTKYLPAFGGFGIYGLANEFAQDGWPWSPRHMGPSCDPMDGWIIYREILYCNHSVGRKWDVLSTIDATIERAAQRWEQFYGDSSIIPMNNGCYCWNWAECYAESIFVPGQDQNRSELVLFDNEAVVSAQTISVAEQLSFAWSLEEISSIDPILAVTLNSTIDYNSEYIAFGVAEILMEGLLIICSPAFRDQNASADCRAYDGEGLRVVKASEGDNNVQVRTSFYDSDTGDYSVKVSCPLYKIWATPRLPARIIFARGQIVDDISRGHAAKDLWELSQVDLLSVVDQILPPVVQPRPVALRSLPYEGSWISLGKGVADLLNDRVRIFYEFFQAGSEIVIQTTLETDFISDRYVAFGVSPEFMTGLIVVCRVDNPSVSDCRQWRGETHNLRPLDPYVDPGGWTVTRIDHDEDAGIAVFTIAAYLSDVVAFADDFDLNQLRGISAIGEVTDYATPMKHAPSDATSFLLKTDEQSAGDMVRTSLVPLLIVLILATS